MNTSNPNMQSPEQGNDQAHTEQEAAETGIETQESENEPQDLPDDIAAAYAEDQIPLDQIDQGDSDEMASLKEEVAAMKDQALRALAEAENARTRAKKDREEASKFAIAGFARDLLPVVDNLRRALNAMPEDADPNMVTGIEATERDLLRTLEKNGLKKLEPLGEVFDPNLHEVMFEAPPPAGEPAGTILQVVEPGYTLNERILRPARVGVAQDVGQGNTDDPSRPGGQVNLDA